MTENPDLYCGNIIKSRIRLARNVNGLPFFIKDVKVANQVTHEVATALFKEERFNVYKMSELSTIKRESLKERHLISEALIKNSVTGACLINDSLTVSVMLHEEDVIREQCILSGLRLFEAYKKLNHIDDEISKRLDVAYDEKLGYLTACPTNVGTGMRASVMMFLPALSESGKIKHLMAKVIDLGFTVRGIYGEGSFSEGGIYQISNEMTIGLSEYEILESVSDTVLEICREERKLEEELYIKNEIKTTDKARKSFGVLTNALTLTYEELLFHLQNVKLGAMLGLINIDKIEELDELLLSCRKSVILDDFGKNLTETELEIKRAEITRNKLLKIKE